METPGLDHISLSVSDLERSRAFYADVLGFELQAVPRDYPDKLFAGSYTFFVGGVEFELIKHPDSPAGDRFDEKRIGLDHLSFKAPNAEALHQLAKKLQAAGVPTKGVEVYAPNGKQYVSFRDPDNIQLEYWLDQPA